MLELKWKPRVVGYNINTYYSLTIINQHGAGVVRHICVLWPVTIMRTSKFETIYITMFEHPENGGVFAKVIKPVVANLVSVQDCRTTDDKVSLEYIYNDGLKDRKIFHSVAKTDRLYQLYKRDARYRNNPEDNEPLTPEEELLLKNITTRQAYLVKYTASGRYAFDFSKGSDTKAYHTKEHSGFNELGLPIISLVTMKPREYTCLVDIFSTDTPEDGMRSALWTPLLYKTGKKDADGNDVYEPKLSII